MTEIKAEAPQPTEFRAIINKLQDLSAHADRNAKDLSSIVKDLSGDVKTQGVEINPEDENYDSVISLIRKHMSDINETNGVILGLINEMRDLI